MMQLLVDAKTLQITLEKEGVRFQTLDSFRPYLAYGGTGGIYGVKDVEKVVSFFDAAKIEENEYKSGVGSGIEVTFSGFAGPAEGLSFKVLVWKEDATDIVRAEWIPLSEGAKTPTAVYFPGPFAFEEKRRDHVTLLNNQQGLLIPNDWPEAVTKASFGGFLGTAGAYMPWFAQIKKDKGLLSICETPWNAAYDIDHPAEGPYTHMAFRFEPSLGHMTDRRIVRMQLVDGDFNAVCKAYRAYAIETGRLVTLKEKMVRLPGIQDLVGTCFVHAGIKTKVHPDSDFFDPAQPEKNDHLTTFEERAQMVDSLASHGVEKMYLHLDGWAQPGYDNCHPDYFPICEEAGGAEGMRHLVDTIHKHGFRFGIHDQYRDFYRTAKSFDPRFATLLADGTIPEHKRWAGGSQSYLCASLAPYYVRRNFEKLFKEGIELDGAYLDVFTCNEGDECTNPEHLMTRKDCYGYRQECFRFLHAHQILSSSEEVNDWAMPTLVFCHYAPYDFQMREPGSPKQGIPVPLFNLVYHDCVIEPWMMDIVDTQAADKEGASEAAQEEQDPAEGKEDYMLYALQNGGAPYLIRNAAYPNIDGAFGGSGITIEEAVSRCEVVQKLHEKVALEEMLSCKLLNEEGTKQRVTFAGGTSVTLDFENQTYLIEG